MIKKRYLISFLVTVIVIILSSRLWLVSEELPVELVMNGSGNVGVKVVTDRRDNLEFKKTKQSPSLSISIREYMDHFYIAVPRAKKVKGIKLVFNAWEDLKNVKINLYPIVLKDGTWKLDDLSSYRGIGANIEIKNNFISITPEQSEFEVIYDKILAGVKGDVKFDVCAFITILILTYLLSLQITNYLADFKDIQHQSRIEIIFLLVISILIVLPAGFVNREQGIVKYENRVLKELAPIINQNGAFNYNFGKDFEAWFNDRFFLRDEFLALYKFINIYLSGNMVQLNNTYFYKDSGEMYRVPNQDSFKSYTNEEIKTLSSHIKYLKQYCYKHNIKMYILITPNKNEFLCDKSTILKQCPFSKKTQQFFSIAGNGYNVISPMQSLKTSKEDVYLRSDTHMTDIGSYIMYLDLINAINHDFPDIKPTPLNDFNISYNSLTRINWDRIYRPGNLDYGFSDLYKDMNNISYPYFDYKYLDKILINKGHPYMDYSNPAGKYRIFIFGDSFSETLSFFLDTNFKTIKKVRYQPLNEDKITFYEQLLENFPKEKNDIFILIFNSEYLRDFAQ